MSLALTASFLVAACSGGETAAAPTEAVVAPTAAVAPAAPAAAAVAAPAAPAAAPIAVAGPGFTFAPVRGTAGGLTDGAQMGEGCIGSFPTAAQHTLQVGAVVPHLRVLVNAGSADTTLAIRTPDGRTLCNDDSGDPGNSLNPVVDIENAPAGAYQVFVGGYSAGDSWATYQLGLSEAADSMPSVVVPAP
jgi:hypothetical protein